MESSSCQLMSGHSLPGSSVHCQFMRLARSMTISGSYLASAGGCTHLTVAPMAPAEPCDARGELSSIQWATGRMMSAVSFCGVCHRLRST